MNIYKYLLVSLLAVVGITSCDLISQIEYNNEPSDKIQVITNIPDSNWESIIAMSSTDAICLNFSDPTSSEMMAVIDNNSEIRMTFDENRRPSSLTLEDAEFYTEYLDDHCNLIYIINGLSGIETIPLSGATKASGENAYDFALDVTRSELFGKVTDKADEIIEEKIGAPNVLGKLNKFIELVNTLRELDDIDNALELVEYLETSNDIVKLIDLIKTKPNNDKKDKVRYAVGIITGDSEIEGPIATLTLEGTIKGNTKGKECNFEYGFCYCKDKDMPFYSDEHVGVTFTGTFHENIIIVLHESFKTPHLDEGKYYYRGYFKDNKTGNIIYSNFIEKFEIEQIWVDLDLPSGILWAAYNVGASSPEEYGGYYAWGETEEKTNYSWENYLYGEKEYFSNGEWEWIGKSIGNNISGTKFDVATAIWGDGARMPTLSDINELAQHCTFQSGKSKDTFGLYLIGPNGNRIFLPFGGYIDCDGIEFKGDTGYYWLANIFEGYPADSCTLAADSDGMDWSENWDRAYAHSVRAVKDNK